MPLTNEEKRQVIREVYQLLAQDLYVILQRMGMSASRAAHYAVSLQQRGRTKSVKKDLLAGQYSFEGQNLSDISSFFPTPEKEKVSPPKTDPLTCPGCGRATLAQATSADDLGQELVWQCVNCALRLSQQELVDNAALRDFTLTLMGNEPLRSAEKSIGSEDLLFVLSDWTGIKVDKRMSAYYRRFATTPAYYEFLRRKDYLQDLPAEVREEIVNAVLSGLVNNQTLKVLAENINILIEDPVRAEVIARTESVRVANAAILEDLRERGFKTAEWITANDRRTCALCKERHNKLYDIKKNFTKPPLHPGCRCRLV
jgi:SPP1 gp7 family putative phage head morphogenesis protein